MAKAPHKTRHAKLVRHGSSGLSMAGLPINMADTARRAVRFAVGGKNARRDTAYRNAFGPPSNGGGAAP